MIAVINAPQALIVEEKPTGRLRINISTLEQEFSILEYRNGQPFNQKKQWRPVPVGDFAEPEAASPLAGEKRGAE